MAIAENGRTFCSATSLDMQRIAMLNFRAMPVTAALFMLLRLAHILVSAAPVQLAGKPLAFDAASVKPAAPVGAPGAPIGRTGGSGGPGTTNHPGRIRYSAITLKGLLIDAYGVNDFQIQGPGPAGNGKVPD
jgi:hypothetical protein